MTIHPHKRHDALAAKLRRQGMGGQYPVPETLVRPTEIPSGKNGEMSCNRILAAEIVPGLSRENW
jgi:hypothetical protein